MFPRFRSAADTGAIPDETLPAIPPTVLMLPVVFAVMLLVDVLEDER